MVFTLVQISLPIVATVGQPPGETPLGCQVQLVGLLDHLLIALAGIPGSGSQRRLHMMRIYAMVT